MKKTAYLFSVILFLSIPLIFTSALAPTVSPSGNQIIEPTTTPVPNAPVQVVEPSLTQLNTITSQNISSIKKIAEVTPTYVLMKLSRTGKYLYRVNAGGVDIFEPVIENDLYYPEKNKLVIHLPIMVLKNTDNAYDLNSLGLSNDGLDFYAITEKGIQVYSSNGQLKGTIEKTSAGLAISISKDGSMIAIGDGKVIRVWEIASNKELFKVDGQLARFSPDSSYLGIQLKDKLDIRKTSDWSRIRLFPRTIGTGWDFSQDNKLAATESNGALKVYEIESGKNIGLIYKKGKGYYLRFTTDGKNVVCFDEAYGSMAAQETVWNIKDGKQTSASKLINYRTLAAEQKNIKEYPVWYGFDAFSDFDALIIDENLRLIDLFQPTLFKEGIDQVKINFLKNEILTLNISYLNFYQEESRFPRLVVALCIVDNGITIKCNFPRSPGGYSGNIVNGKWVYYFNWPFIFSETGALYSENNKNEIHKMEINSKEFPNEYLWLQPSSLIVSVLPKPGVISQTFIAMDENHDLMVLNGARNEWGASDTFLVKKSDGSTIETWKGGVGSVRFSLDGRFLAFIINENLSIYEIASQKIIAKKNMKDIVSYDFTNEGNSIVFVYQSAKNKKQTITTQLISDLKKAPLQLYADKLMDEKKVINAIVGISYSPDGSLLAAGFQNGQVKIINPLDSKILFEWQAKSGNNLLDLAFSPDGKQLITVFSDGIIQTWGT